jgi:hypothetical protein
MELAILLSLAASVCTATSSVCQRLGARHLERCGEMRGFDALLVFRLARQPTWPLGFACVMTAGIFVFQERLATSPAAMAAEVAGLIVLALGVRTLSGSELITHTTQPRRPEAGEATNRELTRRSG